MKSKFSRIQEALQRNPKIIVVHVHENFFRPCRANGYLMNQVFIIYVAPKIGLYTAEELQALMTALVPGLRPKHKNNFRKLKHEMEFGELYFEEVIGKLSLWCKASFTSKAEMKDHLDDKRGVLESQKVWREICVRLLPNVQFANAALSGEYVH